MVIFNTFYIINLIEKTVMIVRYNTLIPFLKTGQKLLLVIIDDCLATRLNGLICHTWYNQQSLWQIDFPYLDTRMTLPERHTNLSIYGFIEISSNIKVIIKSLFYILKNQNKG